MQLKKDFSNLYTYLDKCTRNGYFYNPKTLLSYHRALNIISATRSVGKTTVIAILALLNWKINGKKFIYSRRTKETTRDGAKDFLSNAVDIIHRCTELQFGNCFYHAGSFWEEFVNETGEVEKVEIGTTLSLGDVYKKKSATPRGTDIIIYDEFIAESSREYLGTKAAPEEYERLINLYQTVDRDVDHPVLNETILILMGNTSTIYNPVYNALDMSLYIKRGAHFIRPKGKLWVLEQLDHVKATEDIENSIAFQLSTKDQQSRLYKNFALQDDFTSYVKKLDGFAYPRLVVILDNKSYTLYHNTKTQDMYFVSGGHQGVETISLDIGSDAGHDYRLVVRWSENLYLQIASDFFKMRKLWFDNQITAMAIMKYLQFID